MCVSSSDFIDTFSLACTLSDMIIDVVATIVKEYQLVGATACFIASVLNDLMVKIRTLYRVEPPNPHIKLIPEIRELVSVQMDVMRMNPHKHPDRLLHHTYQTLRRLRVSHQGLHLQCLYLLLVRSSVSLRSVERVELLPLHMVQRGI